MIGILDQNKIFEFRNFDDLAKSINMYAEHYEGGGDGITTIVIFTTGSTDKVKAILTGEYWYFPITDADISLETDYYLRFFVTRKRIDDIVLPEKNSELPTNMKANSIKAHSFKSIICQMPKQIG